MNLYIITTGCYSDTQQQLLLHDKKYSVEEFNAIINEIKSREIIKKYDFDYELFGRCIAGILVKEYGFKSFKYINYDDDDRKCIEKDGCIGAEHFCSFCNHPLSTIWADNSRIDNVLFCKECLINFDKNGKVQESFS